MKWLPLLLLLLVPSALAQLPPVPPGAPGYVAPIHSPKHKAFIDSLGTPMAKPAAVVVNVATPPTLTLLWDYPADLLTNVVFQVFHAATLTNTPPITRYDQVPNNFTLLSVVDGYTSMVINRAYGAEFFIVRALDKVSGVFSNWNAP